MSKDRTPPVVGIGPITLEITKKGINTRCGFAAYPKIRERLESIIHKALVVKGQEEKDTTEFFNILEAAMRTALTFKSNPLQHRSQIRAEIEKMRGAKTAKEIMARSPLSTRGIVARQIALSQATSEHGLNKVARLVANWADEKLAGQGRDKDLVSINLAAEIADAFRRIGLKPVASRPTYHDNATAYYQVVQICYRLAGLSYKDPYKHMKDALQTNIYR